MPIGPITPGSYVTVTADVGGNIYDSVQAPSPSMPVVGADLQALTLVTLNIQEALNARRYLYNLQADADPAYSQTTSSTTYVHPPGSVLLVPGCTQSDVLVVSLFVPVHLNASSNSAAFVRALGRDNYPSGIDTPIDGSELQIDKTEPGAIELNRKLYSITFSWDVLNEGTTRIGFQGRVVSALDTLSFGGARFIVVQHFRIGV